jgi:hypothetical protein
MDIWSSGIYSKVIIVDKNRGNAAIDILDEEIEAVVNAPKEEGAQARESQPPEPTVQAAKQEEQAPPKTKSGLLLLDGLERKSEEEAEQAERERILQNRCDSENDRDPQSQQGKGRRICRQGRQISMRFFLFTPVF